MRLIDADAFKARMAIGLNDCLPELSIVNRIAVAQEVTRGFMQDIDEEPTVEAEPVRHGKWLPPVIGKYGCLCSDCKKQSDNPFNYCPNCGAKMDEEASV